MVRLREGLQVHRQCRVRPWGHFHDCKGTQDQLTTAALHTERCACDNLDRKLFSKLL